MILFKDKSLEDFMVMIQIWGHELFPNSKFKDFITDAEKLCSSRRMRVVVAF